MVSEKTFHQADERQQFGGHGDSFAGVLGAQGQAVGYRRGGRAARIDGEGALTIRS